jgi:phenylacetate-CoA ligase
MSKTIANSATNRDERLVRQLELVARTSTFYSEKAERAGVALDAVRGIADLPRLPLTEKDELRRSQDEHPPLGRTQGASLERLARVQATGGTTGVPMRIGFTAADIDVLDEVAARCIRWAGGGPGDLVFQCMNYSLYVGGVTDHMAFETAGCCVLPYGVGQSTRLLEIARAMETPWCLYSTPAYALRLAEVARELGMEPRSLRLSKGFFSGEAGLGVPGVRRRIEETWGLVARDFYGLSETGFVAAERDGEDGLTFLAEDALVAELIDPETEESLPVEPGVRGELVYTSIGREASPLVRFRSHDLALIQSAADDAGRFRFELLGRTDDMFIVRGVNVFPLAVADVLTSFTEVTGEFEVVLDRPPPIDYDPRVRVERAADAAPGEDLGARIARAIQSRLNFTPRVELVEAGTVGRAPGKTRRLVRDYGDPVP